MNLIRKLTFPRQPIKNVLFLGFGGVTLLAVAIVLYMGLNYTTKLTKVYHHLLIDTALNKLTQEVESLLIPVEDQALWLNDQVKSGDLDIDDYSQVETFIRGMLAGTPHVTGAGIIYRDGTSRYMLREQNTWLVKQETTALETEKLFRVMSQMKSPVWSRLVWYDLLKQTIVDLRLPLYKNGKIHGVLFIGVTVAQLSQSILNTSTDQYLTPFVLYGEDHLLAHPLLTSGSTLLDPTYLQRDWIDGVGDIPLPSVREYQDQILARLVKGPVFPAGLISPIRDVTVNRARINGDVYLIATRRLMRFGKTPWVTGVYINAEKSDRTVAMQLFEMAGVGAIILIVSVVLSLKVGKKMARPIIRLSEAARSMRIGDFERQPPLPRSRLRELDQASLAFNDMMEGIRERDMIREVFGRYVPESVAASLMQENGELPPTSTTATILFSDIEGFTQLTEEVGPVRIVSILNSYFSIVVEVMEKYGGVVTQFQGDAVLVTFNVPIQSDDHAEKALQAALETEQILKNRTFEGVHLKSRFGINTGNVVAGAVGARGRLNYTVHGDAVNLASRIESLNKKYQTTILLSEKTRNLIKTVELEEIGQTKVRGHSRYLKLFVPKR